MSLAALLVLAGGGNAAKAVAAAEPVVLEVTTASDTIPAPACPDAANCTLRKAIETANVQGVGTAVRISFSDAAFPRDSPKTIDISSQPLPPIRHDDVAIDGSGRGVVLAGTTSGATPSLNGLVSEGARAIVRGLTIHGFVGDCLHLAGEVAVVGGDPAAGQGNSLDDCGVAIRVDGGGGSIFGNYIGLSPSQPGTYSVGAGLWVTGSDARVGPTSNGDGFSNRIGNADTAIRLGGIGTSPISGTSVSRNVLGTDPADNAAPIGTGVSVLAPTAGAVVVANSIAHARTGVAVQGSATGPSARNVTISNNVFRDISVLAIDLNDDGIHNPNHPGDTTAGANGLLNSPVISRALQAEVSGVACAGCQVQLYLAQHHPGGATDYGTRPLTGGVTVAGATGSFTATATGLSPGDWMVALATDSTGNTSEFGASVRVGAGSVQCGNIPLRSGWNLVGYFGAEPLPLGSEFPGEGSSAGAVRAVYQLDAASGTYSRWLAETGAGRTLASLTPGATYWMLADSTVALDGGFSLSAPVPVVLSPGWNTFVYIGATAPVADALQSIAGRYADLVSWASEGQDWRRFGSPDIPGWAQDFNAIQACTAYELFATEPATLTPLQP